MVASKNLSLSFWEKNKQTWNGDVECCGKKVDILKALAREDPIKKVTYERRWGGWPCKYLKKEPSGERKQQVQMVRSENKFDMNKGQQRGQMARVLRTGVQ